jgi:transcriptional antiterminator
MKTMTIIFLIRRADNLLDELFIVNGKSDMEIDLLVTMYNRVFDMLKLVVSRYWLTTDVKKLKKELNDFQLNLYGTLENKVVRKYYNENYWLN